MRWILRLFFTLLTLAILATGAAFLIPTERIAALAAQQFKTLTGRELTISGSVRPSIWPQLGVRTGPVTISNAEWSKVGPMLQAEALEIGLDMPALMNGVVKITRVEATSPVLVLERAKDGRANWELGGQNGGSVTPSTPGVGSPFTLDTGVIRGGVLRYIDHQAGSRIELSAINATAAFPTFDGPMVLDLSGMLNGQGVALKGQVAEFSTLLRGKVVPLSLTLTAGAAKVGFEGRMGSAPLTAEGALQADLADLAAVSALAGVARPALPEGLGARTVAVSGAVTLTDAGAVYLRGGRVTLDGNVLTGDADILTAGERPKVSAQITAGMLNLAGVAGAGGGGTSGARASGWSTAPIDASGLGALDATVALTAEGIDLGGAKLGATRVLMALDRARAVFDLREIAAYGGTISGQFVANGRGGLSLGGDIRVAGLAMQPLLADVAGYDRLIGTGDIALKFLAVGNSMDALMQGLSGSGQFSFGKGELRGLDLAGMLRTLDTGYVGEGAKTIFDAITASFTIKDGVLSNDDLVLAAPLVKASGAGKVGIGARTLDYRMQPVALAEADGTGGITVPLLITGPWAAPKFRLDLEALAREKLEFEAKALEEKARVEADKLIKKTKADLAAKAEKELGLKLQEGEDLEAAAKRRATEALQEEGAKALQNLLGGN